MLKAIEVVVTQPVLNVLTQSDEAPVVEHVYKSFSRGTKRQGKVDVAVKAFLHKSTKESRIQQRAWDAQIVSLDAMSEEDLESLGQMEASLYDRHSDPDEDSNLCRQFWAEQGMSQGGVCREFDIGFRHQVY